MEVFNLFFVVLAGLLAQPIRGQQNGDKTACKITTSRENLFTLPLLGHERVKMGAGRLDVTGNTLHINTISSLYSGTPEKSTLSFLGYSRIACPKSGSLFLEGYLVKIFPSAQSPLFSRLQYEQMNCFYLTQILEKIERLLFELEYFVSKLRMFKVRLLEKQKKGGEQ